MTVAALPADVSEVPAETVVFLAHMAVALHKIRAYPGGHPMRRVAVEAGYRSLGTVLADGPFRVGVSRTQFVVDRAATDPDHFVLRDLAARLHRVQVGSLTFEPGATEAEFTDVLERLAAESVGVRTDGGGLGVEGTDHIRIAPIAFDALSLAEGDSTGSEVDRHWQALAEVVGHPGGATISTEFAQAMAERLGSPEGRLAVAAAMERLGRWTQEGEGQGDEAVRHASESRLRDLLATIPLEGLQRLLGVDFERRESLRKLLPAVDWLPTMALIDVVEGAAQSRKEGISSVLLRLLNKLAHHNEVDGAAPAGRELRGLVRSLLDSWTLDDPNTRANLALMEALSKQDPAAATRVTEGDEAFRVVRMALELDAIGDHVDEAIEELVARGEIDELITLAVTVESGTLDLIGMIAEPKHCQRVLADRRVSLQSIETVLGRVGPDQAPFLADRLLASDWPEVRRMIGEKLLSEEFAHGAEVLRRLVEAGRDEQCGLLELLADLGRIPTGLELAIHLESADPSLRLAAYRLALTGPDRDQMLPRALGNPEERVVRLAVECGLERFPRQGLARLMSLLNGTRRSEALRAQAVAILAQFDEPTIREWLLAGMVAPGRWLRRSRLVPATPIVLAKLGVLASKWAGTPEVERVLALARRSGNPAAIAAVQVPAGES